MRTDLDADVAVVGCGPVGAVLAILLGQSGRSVIVVDKWPEPYERPRAVHFDHEVGRILQSCGIGDRLRRIIDPADTYEWRNAAGTTLLRFGRAGNGPSGWPLSSMFNQPALERLLGDRLSELPGVDVRRGVEVTGLDQEQDSVVLRTLGGGTIRSAYAVGCDGANSAVRQATATPVTDLGYFYDWLVVDVILDVERVFEPLNLQVCDPARPTTVVSGGPGRRRWEFMRLPHESLEDLNRESCAWRLLEPWDVRPGNARLERHAVYTFRARYADRWRTGRILLAGDAAHLTPPFAGQGMCAGVRDAANLAWKLDLVLASRAGPSLLDAYQSERLPSARASIEFAMELGKVICVSDPAEAAARDEVMSAAVGPEPADVPDVPGPAEGILDPDSPAAGLFFVQPRVDGRFFDDLHGAGWRLVSAGDDPERLDGDPLAWFLGIGGRAVAADPADPVLAAWCDAHGARWVLQRPDFHVYGTASDAAGASQLLARLRAHLSRDRDRQGVLL